jgi:phosphopantothenate-cysteine ligase
MGRNGRLVPIKAEGSAAAKIPSIHKRLFVELAPTEKLIDHIRKPWGFTGKLVKFKLQADMSDDDLLAIAKKSLAHSNADLLVANCLEWSKLYAYIVDASGGVEKVSRDQLALRLMERLT